MSQQELTRHDIMQRLQEKRLNQPEAALLLGLSLRQVKRLWQAYRQTGVQSLLSKRRGQPSNHQLAPALKSQALTLLRQHYADFGPTLAHEKLVEVHALALSRESVRQLMIAEGLWRAQRAHAPQPHPLRLRRAARGELVQIDGSPHNWFEGRGPRCTLLVFIDDATGCLMMLWFAAEETTLAYFAACQQYFPTHGKPLAFYSDRDGIFRINKKDALSGSGLTQFGRAMRSLDIEIICANSPQAKGRVERANQTLQDRLVKELRLRQISSIAAANQYLPEFIEDFNRRFAVAPRSPQDLHRPLQASEKLPQILTLQETRLLSKELTLQYKKVLYQIETKRPAYTLRQQTVTVCEDGAGEITILYQGRPLAYTIYQRQERQAEVTPPKALNGQLEQLATKEKKPRYVPPPDHPWRRFEFGANAKQQ